MKISRRDPFTGKINTLELDVTVEQLRSYDSGELIQRAFPNLSADERKFIITGIPPGKFEEYLGEDDDN